MKKKLYLLFGLVMSLLLVGIVKAEGPYFFDWKTKSYDDRMIFLNEPYKDGYITVDGIPEKYYVTIYNAKGEEQTKKTFNDVGIMDFAVDGANIYMLVYDYDEEWFFLELYNDKLELQKDMEVIVPFFDVDKFLIVQSDKIILIGTDNGVKQQVIEKDLSDSEVKPLSNNALNKLLPEIAAYDVAYDSDIDHIEEVDAYSYKNGKYAFGLKIADTSCEGAMAPVRDGENPPTTSSGRCYFVNFAIVDEDGNKELLKELPIEYYEISEVKFVDDYILVAAADNDDNVNILVYDLKGNLLQTIESELGFINIVDTPNGFIVGEGYCRMESVSKVGVTSDKQGNIYNDKGCCMTALEPLNRTQRGTGAGCEVRHTAYYNLKKIDTVVTEGKGKVEVAGEQRPGEPVTFVVTPDKGYTLGAVKVTDAQGNVITFTKDDLKGNTFTMPTADVTIEVEFLVQNAATADIAIITVAIIAVISGAIVFINNKKILKAK